MFLTGVYTLLHKTTSKDTFPIGSNKKIKCVSENAKFINTISKGQISAYIRTGEPFDKAGAFAAQGKGAVFIERIEEDFFNIVGLPLLRLGKIMESFGVSIFEENFS